MCPRIETSRASSTPSAQTPQAPLLVEPRHSRAAWLVWGALHVTLGLACVCSGVSPYVKTVVGLGAVLHAWLARPRQAAACRLAGGVWYVGSGGDENRRILTRATYTRYWVELVFERREAGPRRVLLWRDALTPQTWRALIVHLREAAGGAARQPRSAPRGHLLDVGRHDE